MTDFLHQFDVNILFYIQEHIKSPVLDRVMVFFTRLGDAGLIWFAVAFLLLSTKRYRKCGIYLVLTIYLTMLLSDEVLKHIFHRIRPCNVYDQVQLLIRRPHSFSFPSGHTMIGFASATVLYYYHRNFGIAGYILAFLIAISRIYLFVHYPTDILGGIVFGIVSTAILIFGLNKVNDILENKKPKSA